MLGYGAFPVVIAKTHLSLSSDPALVGAPTAVADAGPRGPGRGRGGLRLRDLGDMRTMPGLSKHPVAERIDLDEDGRDRRAVLTPAGAVAVETDPGGPYGPVARTSASDQNRRAVGEVRVQS